NVFKKFHNFCCVYIYDILIFSNNLQKKIIYIYIYIYILQECRKSMIVLFEKKTVIAKQKIKYLELKI
ncbi:MAG: hypothetical protein MCS20_02065, partial [Candidatus Phytoplasma mali]|nr:hypothetical protein [Candidatus Phytoplasma australiense]MBZ7920160.1 hypothetical protein [Candidatus Karelsulcia muelleri]MCG7202176.1 hypothetical protein [Candidatus Phytoplasma mali]MCZ8632845.1 hypothetical protein [Spiroplasma sp. Tabriz.8]